MSDFPLERVFTDDDPYFLNQKHLARGYESYSRKHNLVRISDLLHQNCLMLTYGCPKEHMDQHDSSERLLR